MGTRAHVPIEPQEAKLPSDRRVFTIIFHSCEAWKDKAALIAPFWDTLRQRVCHREEIFRP